MGRCMGEGKVCIQNEAMVLMVLHGWGGRTGFFEKP